MNVVNFAKRPDLAESPEIKTGPEVAPSDVEKLRKRFMRQKRAWIDGMSLDHDLPSFAFRLAYHIASKYLNSTSGDAWPKQTTLAADLGVCVKTIQNGLVALEKAGLIAVQGSRGLVNHYRPIFETIAHQPTQILTQVGSEGAPILTPDPRKFLRPTHVKSFLHEPFLSNPLKKEVSKKESTDLTVVDGGPIIISVAEENPPITMATNQLVVIPADSVTNFVAKSSGFERWWNQYPKRVGKFKAEQAYLTAITKKKATDEELLTGAMRYSAERSGQEDKYTKHPATWLNAGGWLDEPNLPTRSLNRGDSAVAGMRGFLEDEICPPHIYRNVL
jgi:helix-turn-helix protein